MKAEYYLYNDMLDDSDLGFAQSQIWKLPRTGVSWVSGGRHRTSFALPIEAELNPEFGTELLDSYHEAIPIWSDRLIGVLQACGVDNLDLYDAVLRDRRTGLRTSEYKAVNVIGNVDAADMRHSVYDPRSERGAREFHSLVIDPTKTAGLKMFRLHERPTVLIISRDVRDGLVAARIRGVRADAVELTPE